MKTMNHEGLAFNPNQQANFSVDSQGQVEEIPREYQLGRQVLTFGLEGGAKVSFAPRSGERVAESEYFVDPVGRVIDTRTGELVFQGDGTPRVNLGELSKHEKNKQNK